MVRQYSFHPKRSEENIKRDEQTQYSLIHIVVPLKWEQMLLLLATALNTIYKIVCQCNIPGIYGILPEF